MFRSDMTPQQVADAIQAHIRTEAEKARDTQSVVEKKVVKLAERVAADPNSDRKMQALMRSSIELAERKSATIALYALLGSTTWRVP